ncbi:MAG: endonuclease/exonuclease/phosphatase family protein [Prevotella sp.]|nr:endonuclease/exonuclease/phosphatase family protein [Prevotella sp.]
MIRPTLKSLLFLLLGLACWLAPANAFIPDTNDDSDGYPLTLVELNCENLFDCADDSLYNDNEWLPDAIRRWTPRKYWRKLNSIGQEIIACGEQADGSWALPDLVALSEVENDSVLVALSRRSLLRKAGYEYVMTQSNDERGIDVALLYSPFAFRLLHYHALRVVLPQGRHATRDILYAAGEVMNGDTLHVFVVHAPSRYGGERASRPFRLRVAERICQSIDSIRCHDAEARIIVAGDFNAYVAESSLRRYEQHGLVNVARNARGTHGARGTYRYQGEWGSLDQILTSPALAACLDSCYIFDAPFLMEKDDKYGGLQPRRTYRAYRYNGGYSDHLPLVARFRLRPRTGE